ncbi:MAG TPA: site-specific integrase [Bosea sp. (in: a-proteobacteria)]|uniref:site-specific integrase n=1 Tax=Bosea sp. (in: a-proteobacteria) TaxID=1871050 RepID=UPI002E15E4D3|nr:site-specific integrase [Bosea sp. (in: a-proteobacteria)]
MTNTVRHKLVGIAYGLAFCEARGIDLVERAAAGVYLTWDELSALADSCREAHRGGSFVLSATAALRFNAFIPFFLWRTETVLARANADNRRLAILGREQFEARVRSTAPKANHNTGPSPGELLGLTQRQRELFWRVITAGDPSNPFRPDLQFRNQAILATAYRLGLRAGELLALKARDLRLADDPATVTIHRRHNDPEDPRKPQPVAKTRARVLELDVELRDTLTDWIVKHRANRNRFPAARKHPFVFVNHRGEPLSDRGLRKVYERLRACSPELSGLIGHVLRHDWNDRWVELAAAEGWDHSEAEQDQKYAMGWSLTSKMPERYGRRAIRNRANSRILRLQEKATGK